jgi:hypothetical protein
MLTVHACVRYGQNAEFCYPMVENGGGNWENSYSAAVTDTDYYWRVLASDGVHTSNTGRFPFALASE